MQPLPTEIIHMGNNSNINDTSIDIIQEKQESTNWSTPDRSIQFSEKLGFALNIIAKLAFILAIACTIRFSIHPIGPVIHITHAFYMRLPLLIAAGTGITILLTLIIVRSKFQNIFAKILSSSALIRNRIQSSMVAETFGLTHAFDSNQYTQKFIQDSFSFAKDLVAFFENNKAELRNRTQGTKTLMRWLDSVSKYNTNLKDNSSKNDFFTAFANILKNQQHIFNIKIYDDEEAKDAEISFDELEKIMNYMNSEWGLEEEIVRLTENKSTNIENKSKIVNLNLTEEQNPLKAYWFDNNKSKTIILFHGNGTTAEEMLWDKFPEIFKDYNVLVYAYRGCGINANLKRADYERLEEEALNDVELAYQFVKNETSKRDGWEIIAYGHSLGSAYASMLADKHDIKVILDQPFSTPAACISNVAKVLFRNFAEKMMKYLFSCQQGQRPWDSVARIKNKKIFVIEGKNDNLMKGCGKELLQAAYQNAKDRQENYFINDDKHFVNVDKFDKELMNKIKQMIHNKELK